MTFLGYEWYYDAHLIPIYIVMVIFAFLLLYTSLIAHEFGHALYFYLKLKKKIRLKLGLLKCYAGEQEDYDSLTNNQYVSVNVWGIFIGLIPIGIASLFVSIMWLMVVPYLVAVRQDLMEVSNNIKWDDET